MVYIYSKLYYINAIFKYISKRMKILCSKDDEKYPDNNKISAVTKQIKLFSYFNHYDYHYWRKNYNN